MYAAEYLPIMSLLAESGTRCGDTTTYFVKRSTNCFKKASEHPSETACTAYQDKLPPVSSLCSLYADCRHSQKLGHSPDGKTIVETVSRVRRRCQGNPGLRFMKEDRLPIPMTATRHSEILSYFSFTPDKYGNADKEASRELRRGSRRFCAPTGRIP